MLAHLVHLNKKNSGEGEVTPSAVKVRIVVWKLDKGCWSQCVLEEYAYDNFYAKFDKAIIEVNEPWHVISNNVEFWHE